MNSVLRKKFVALQCLSGISALLVAMTWEPLVAQGTEEAIAVAHSSLITRKYKVPSNFLYADQSTQTAASRVLDPFAPNDFTNPYPFVGTRDDRNGYLHTAGITFGAGTSAVFDQDASELHMRNTPEQHKRLEAFLDAIVAKNEKQIHILLENIEVETNDFSEWLLSNRITRDATPFRKAVQKWIEDGNATLADSSMVTAKHGLKARAEWGNKIIYPAQYATPDTPNKVSASDGTDFPVGGVYVSSLQNRRIGHAFEVRPVIDSETMAVDLDLSPEKVVLAGYTTWPTKETDPLFRIRMPTFHVSQIHTWITVLNGRYAFFGNSRPPESENSKRKNPTILHFVRADVANVAGSWSVETVETE